MTVTQLHKIREKCDRGRNNRGTSVPRSFAKLHCSKFKARDNRSTQHLPRMNCALSGKEEYFLPLSMFHHAAQDLQASVQWNSDAAGCA